MADPDRPDDPPKDLFPPSSSYHLHHPPILTGHAATGAPPAPLARALAMRTEFHQGPLPPARDFAEYEAAHPGTADWILREAAGASQHARAIEAAALRLQARDALLFRLLPFLVVVILLLSAAAMAIWANPWLGGGAFVVTLGSVLVAYMRTNSGQREPPGQDATDGS